MHNGWTFLAEPQLVSLSSPGENWTGSLSRRPSKPIPELQMRSQVELPDLLHDPAIAVIIILDYLVGLSGSKVTCLLKNQRQG